jgi:hypothetical protein
VIAKPAAGWTEDLASDDAIDAYLATAPDDQLQ